jgi:hypothetical protein
MGDLQRGGVWPGRARGHYVAGDLADLRTDPQQSGWWAMNRGSDAEEGKSAG